MEPGVNLDSELSTINTDNVEDLTNLIKQKLSFYQQEVTRMESMFLKLGLIDEQSKTLSGSLFVEKLSDLQQKLNVKELTPNAAALAHADRLRNQKNHTAKLKIYLKLYMSMNQALEKQLKMVKCEYEQAQEKLSQIVTITPSEFKALEQKISRYEQELNKIESRNPWLKNKEIDLKHIEREVASLKAARTEKEELLKELSVYQGLRPDIQQASEQLAKVKGEYKKVVERLSEQ